MMEKADRRVTTRLSPREMERLKEALRDLGLTDTAKGRGAFFRRVLRLEFARLEARRGGKP